MASHTKTIKLSGSLGRRFGVFHKLAVDSVAECIRALSYQVEGFKPFMQSKVGSNTLSAQRLWSQRSTLAARHWPRWALFRRQLSWLVAQWFWVA
ncbi:hypothetical protein RCIP0026_00018 [Klebsiella phage RCIP0026]